MTSEQFEVKHNQLRIVFQSHLNSNEMWTVGDFRNEADTQAEARIEAEVKAKVSYTSGKQGHFARDCWSRDASHRERVVHEVVSP